MFIYQGYTNIYYYLRYKILKLIPNIFHKYILKYKYKKFYKTGCDLKSPKKLSEKIQYIKLYGDKRQKTYLSDKLLVKNYIKDFLPELKCAKVYQIGKSFKDIALDELPEEFVLKTNHAWNTNIFIENKSALTNKDLKAISEFYKKILKINFAYWSYYEMQYKDIKPFIYAEKFLGGIVERKEYEVWCFNGNIEFITYKQTFTINNNPVRKIIYYNANWEEVEFCIQWKCEEKILPNENRNKVIEYAKFLSKDIDFVRIDFMEVNDELYFCEMTFTPFSGYIDIQPRQYDLILGKKLKLDCNK